ERAARNRQIDPLQRLFGGRTTRGGVGFFQPARLDGEIGRRCGSVVAHVSFEGLNDGNLAVTVDGATGAALPTPSFATRQTKPMNPAETPAPEIIPVDSHRVACDGGGG